MNKLNSAALSILLLGILLVFQDCGKKDEETAQERTVRILTSKTWVYSSVNTPVNSATIGTDWADFTVSFTQSDMTTAYHPVGAQAVWPSGTYTVNEDGTIISRGDGVSMLLNPISDANFTAIFTIVDEDLGGGRIASLDGEYTFNMK